MAQAGLNYRVEVYSVKTRYGGGDDDDGVDGDDGDDGDGDDGLGILAQVGPVGSGKSSLIRSVKSALKGELVRGPQTGTGEGTVTKVHTHVPFRSMHGLPLRR